MVLVLHVVADMIHFLSTRSRLPLLLILLLAPGVGLAASTPLEPLPASSGLPGTDARAPLRLREDALAPGEQEASRPSRGLRILAGTGASLLTGVGGGTLGFFSARGLCEAGLLGCLDEAALGLVLGAASGFALGAWWGGEWAGGDGKLLGALAGVGSGVVLSLIAGIAVGRPELGLYFTLPGALIGAVVGYELSQQAPAPGPQQAPAVALAPPRPRLQPVLGVSPRGAVVGVGGTF